MSLVTQLFTLLYRTTAAGVKVYPMAAPDQTLAPFITYQRISATNENVLDGGKVNLCNTRVQIDIYSKTYAQAISIASAVDGVMCTGFPQIVSLQAQDIYESEVDLYRVLAQYSIWHMP